MAQTESRVRLIFEGAERGVVAAARKSSAAIRSLDDDNSRLSRSSAAAEKGLLGVGKAMLGLSAAGSAVNVVAGTAGALAQLAPAALLLPGALAAGAAAMGTFKIATAGFGEAIGAGLSGDMEKFAESVKDMHPEMQKAAAAVVKFRPEIDNLKKTVQGEFWDDFSGQIDKLGKNYLPVLTDGLATVAREMGGVAYSAAEALNLPATINDVNEVLDGTSGFLREVGEGVGDLIRGFTGLAGVGATYLPRLGEAIGGVSKRFREWVDSGVESGRIIELIDGAIQGFKDLGGIVGNVGSIVGSVFRGLGADFGSPLATLRELTGQVAEFMETASAQEGLRALGDTLRVVGEQVGRVLMAALRELAPTLVKLAPVAQEVARTLGDLLVGAIETLGPLIRGIADAFNAFPGSASAATVAVVGFVAAIKTIKTVNAVTDLLGIESMFTRIGKSAGGAEAAAGAAGKKAGIAWGKGFTGTLALVGAGVAGTLTADALIPKDIGAWGSQAARDMLGEMAAVFRGEGQSTFAALDIAQWISNPISMGVEVGRRELMKLFDIATSPIEMTFNANTGPAQDQVAGFMNQLKGTSGSVDIDGRTVDAAQALADIVQRINQGQGTVTMNGRNVPAQQALQDVIGQINRGAGTVTVNGQTVPAGQALAAILGTINRSSANVGVGANTASANSALRGLVSYWNGYTIRMNAVVSSRIGGLAGGGPVVGPGSGTSDTAGLYALSNGEYVATARQVDAAGGPAAFGRLMSLLERGQIRSFADGGNVTPMRATAAAAMRTPSAPAASGGGAVQVSFAGNTSDALATVIMEMIRVKKIQLRAA